ncbi:MAG: hypothetical protein V1790_06635 [Planctomycetota bacterium]
MDLASSDSRIVHVYAREHVDSAGSVVRSGMALAEAVLDALESGAFVEVDMAGIKGASSSYFNVFLRRVDEGCGLAVFDDRIKLRFGSNVQQIVYSRSFESLRRGVTNSSGHRDDNNARYVRSRIAWLWGQILAFFRRSF